ncbi:MAG: polyprenyl synthetase family protein, partial [Bacteroidales bacterium]|nr:polyprenyl synthetase family protein [Bacteroidales bacterium]
MLSPKEIQDTVKQLFDSEIFISDPVELYEPIQYTLGLGGKRLRPTLLLAACDMFGGDIGKASAAAVGIEVFHNFTLLHDDLMDKSPLRRGKETVYRRWNENIAILSGDTMFAMAYRYFLKKWHPNMEAILKTFTETAIGVCDGQQYDMNFETQDDVAITEYIMMIRLKTAILLAGAMKIGALYANAPEKDIELLYKAGISMGLAFQLQDDLLDAYGDVSVFGKQT